MRCAWGQNGAGQPATGSSSAISLPSSALITAVPECIPLLPPSNSALTLMAKLRAATKSVLPSMHPTPLFPSPQTVPRHDGQAAGRHRGNQVCAVGSQHHGPRPHVTGRDDTQRGERGLWMGRGGCRGEGNPTANQCWARALAGAGLPACPLPAAPTCSCAPCRRSRRARRWQSTERTSSMRWRWASRKCRQQRWAEAAVMLSRRARIAWRSSRCFSLQRRPPDVLRWCSAVQPPACPPACPPAARRWQRPTHTLLLFRQSQMREVNKGIGIDNLHYLTDGLWKTPTF